MDLLKALGGVNTPSNRGDDAECNAASPAAAAKKTTAEKENAARYNPMANLIERHENAVNRIKRGK